MKTSRTTRITGLFGLIGAILLFIEIPLWIIPGEAPAIQNAAVHAEFLANSRVIALSRILIDMLMYMSLMVFFAGFRNVIIQKNKEYEWIATLTLAAGAVWWAVSLVADGLEGAAILDTLQGNSNPTIVRAMVEATLLIYNGSIAFAVTALFMGPAAYAILKTNALPRWLGWLAWVSFVLCILSIPAMYGDSIDTKGFYNAAGWGPTIVANIPPLIWFIGASLAMMKIKD